MIVNVNPRGHSFLGVSKYLLHDKGAETSERVLWTSTHNLHTDDVNKAARYMAWTDMNRMALRETAVGAKATAGNVYHYSLSAKPGSPAERAEMEKWAISSLEKLGLSEHQFYLVAHGDTEHPHVHIVINLVHPETGKIAKVGRDFKKLDRWAHEFEREHGIECPERAKKYEQWDREPGSKAFKERDALIRKERSQTVSDAFQRSDGAQAFQAALEEHGLTLAKGNRRSLVVVDQEGEIYSLNRLIELDDGITGRVKSRRISAHLGDFDRDSLGQADTVAESRKVFDREAAETERQVALGDAAHEVAEGAIGKEKERVAAEQTAQREERQRRREAALEEREKRIQSWREALAKKTKESRERLQIHVLTKKREAAVVELGQLGGFWAKIFKRKQIAEAKKRVSDLEKRVKEQSEALEKEVQALQEDRPRWVPESALETRVPSPTPEPPQLERPKPPPGRAAEEASTSSEVFDRAARAKGLLEREAQRQAERARNPGRDRGMEL